MGDPFLFRGDRPTAIGAHGSAARADCLPRGKPTVSDGKSQLCRRGAPARGLTRRLRRERWGCRPEGVVLSFEAKESTKESTRHGDYVKKASTAHFAGGARNVARNGVGQLSPTPVRAPVLAFFRRQNGRAFFPSLPIAALPRHSWRGAYSALVGGCNGAA